MAPNLNQVTPAEIWEAFWHLAHAVCTEIEQGKPDLIVVLHGSGAVVWHAVQRVWVATRQAPLPPVITVRIGQRTARVYADKYEPNEWEYMGDDHVGHMVAWSARQTAWHDAMAARLRAVVGDSQPGYVLLVDDVVHDGWTALTAFGVLWSTLPQAKVHLWAGMPDNWREILGVCWMDTHYPSAAMQMRSGWEKDKADLYPDASWLDYTFALPALVSGLAQGGEDALSSGPVSAAFPYADYLTRYMPEAQWVEFSPWIYSTLGAKINEWATGAAAAPAVVPVAHWNPRFHALRAPELAWTQAWIQRWSTLEEFARCCRLSVPETADMMAQLVASGAFVRRATDGSIRFGYKPESGFLVYGPHLASPIDAIWEDVVDQEDAMPPFAVEYARSESKRADAPMLVPVAGGQGVSVRGKVLILDFNYRSDLALELLFSHYRDARLAYVSYEKAVENGTAPVRFDVTPDLAGVTSVYYILDRANLDIVFDPGIADVEKGERLAALAADSLTPDTFARGLDGIQYLMGAIECGVETKLTPYYRDALLRMAENAPDLANVRERLARQKGLA